MGSNNFAIKELSNFHRQNLQKFSDLDTKITKLGQQLDEQSTDSKAFQEKTNNSLKLLTSQVAELLQASRRNNGDPGILSSPSPTHEGDSTDPTEAVTQPSNFRVFNDAKNKEENSIHTVINEEDEFLDLELIPQFLFDENEDDDLLDCMSLHFEEVSKLELIGFSKLNQVKIDKVNNSSRVLFNNFEKNFDNIKCLKELLFILYNLSNFVDCVFPNLGDTRSLFDR
ncbi:hypothetical protein MKW92_005458, partial [Papaver armeniacum]